MNPSVPLRLLPVRRPLDCRAWPQRSLRTPYDLLPLGTCWRRLRCKPRNSALTVLLPWEIYEGEDFGAKAVALLEGNWPHSQFLRLQQPKARAPSLPLAQRKGELRFAVEKWVSRQKIRNPVLPGEDHGCSSRKGSGTSIATSMKLAKTSQQSSSTGCRRRREPRLIERSTT